MSHSRVPARTPALRRTPVLCRTLVLLLALLSLSSAGCGAAHPAKDSAGGLATEKFIEIYIALRHAAVEAGDSLALFEVRRAEILDRYGITGQDLVDYVERRSVDLTAMGTVWDTIYHRLSRGDTTTVP